MRGETIFRLGYATVLWSLTFEAWRIGGSILFVGVLGVIAALNTVPLLSAGVNAFYERLYAVEPPEEFEDTDDAAKWLLLQGYQIVHECDTRGGHVVGVKNTFIPFLKHVREVYVGEEEEE